MQKKLLNYLSALLGAVIMAAALNMFLIPAGIAAGGASGLATVVSHLLGRVADISVGALILVINIPIFIWGRRHFDRAYMIRSLLGMLCLSAATDILGCLKPITSDMILSSVYGGALMGIGIGLVFRAGMTTGGTDIAAHILKKRFPDFSVGRFVLMIDAAVALLSGAAYGRWENVLYSAAALFVSSYVLDLIVEGIDFAKMVFIISDKPEIISAEISSVLEHGSTVLHASSPYTGRKKSVLMCVVKKYEIGKMKKIIQSLDKDAFFIVSDVKEVFGNGFAKF